MDIKKAAGLIKQYEAHLKVRGPEWTRKHYLGEGTSRFEINKNLIKEAYRIIEEGEK